MDTGGCEPMLESKAEAFDQRKIYFEDFIDTRTLFAK
jgi:hypothetical protein